MLKLRDCCNFNFFRQRWLSFFKDFWIFCCCSCCCLMLFCFVLFVWNHFKTFFVETCCWLSLDLFTYHYYPFFGVFSFCLVGCSRLPPSLIRCLGCCGGEKRINLHHYSSQWKKTCVCVCVWMGMDGQRQGGKRSAIGFAPRTHHPHDVGGRLFFSN